jgi:low affinity Fe/Cu permease
MTPRTSWFNRFAKGSARATGKPAAFILAGAIILVWAITGPIFGFSDTWQLVINTSTTIVTFLMVFLIQNTQNRDSDAIQLKLDELIRATRGAHTALLDLEELDDAHLEHLRELYEEIASRSREAIEIGKDDTGTPFVHIEHLQPNHDAEAKDAKTESSGQRAGVARAKRRNLPAV